MKKNNLKDAARQTTAESTEDLKVTETLEISEDPEAIEDLNAAETMVADATEIMDDAEELEDLDDENVWGELKDWVGIKGTRKWKELKGLDKIEDPEELARRKAALNARLDKEFDARIKKAFTKIVKEEYAKRPRKIPKVQFSEDFEQKMNELLYVEPEPEPEKKTFGLSSLLSLFRPVRSRRAIVVVAALMMLLVGTTAGGANPIILWLHDSWMEQHGDYVEIENREEAAGVSKEKFQKYELTELLEGYELKEERFDKEIGMYLMFYVDEGGNTFIFRQGKKENGNLGNFTANRKDIEEVKVNTLEGYYVKDSDMANLVLSDEEYMIIFIGDLSKEQFIELAEGLQVIE